MAKSASGAAIVAIPIIPDKNFLTNIMPAVEAATRNALTGTVKNILAQAMEKRVTYWRAKPHFIGVYRRVAGDMVLLVTPSGSELAQKRWLWTSRGTRKSWRYAKHGYMRFKKYNPKTRPGNVYGIGGSRTSGPTMRAKKVYTGVEARHFEEHIVDEQRQRIIYDITQAINQAVRSVK